MSLEDGDLSLKYVGDFVHMDNFQFNTIYVRVLEGK